MCILCLYEAQISGERLQDHLSSGFLHFCVFTGERRLPKSVKWSSKILKSFKMKTSLTVFLRIRFSTRFNIGLTYMIKLKLGHEINQRTNGPVNAHLISWPSKAQNIQNLENIW